MTCATAPRATSDFRPIWPSGRIEGGDSIPAVCLHCGQQVEGRAIQCPEDPYLAEGWELVPGTEHVCSPGKDSLIPLQA